MPALPPFHPLELDLVLVAPAHTFSSASSISSILFSLHLSLARAQAEKMGMGNLRYTVTFYPGSCLVHVNLAPLVVTLVHKDAQGESVNFNYGDALDLIPELTNALEPLQEHVRCGYQARRDGVWAEDGPRRDEGGGGVDGSSFRTR